MLLSGDIKLNPGPTKNQCSICFKSVTRNHRAGECDSCDLWSHIKCTNLSPREYGHLQTLDDFEFICSQCVMNELPSPLDAIEDSMLINDNTHPLNIESDDIDTRGKRDSNLHALM